jgi:hypothetical protein
MLRSCGRTLENASRGGLSCNNDANARRYTFAHGLQVKKPIVEGSVMASVSALLSAMECEAGRMGLAIATSFDLI